MLISQEQRKERESVRKHMMRFLGWRLSSSSWHKGSKERSFRSSSGFRKPFQVPASFLCNHLPATDAVSKKTNKNSFTCCVRELTRPLFNTSSTEPGVLVFHHPSILFLMFASRLRSSCKSNNVVNKADNYKEHVAWMK